MKLQLLPSTFNDGASDRGGQHFTCFVINDVLAVDAGSLATSVSARQRAQIRDVVLTHAHLDHIAGLPLFIDDLFATLTEPVHVWAAYEIIEVLERDIFNWSVYPRFSELDNSHGPVMVYHKFGRCVEFEAAGLRILPLAVNHRVPSYGFVISDGSSSIAMTGDTAWMDDFWNSVNDRSSLDALFIECAFPDSMSGLAERSHHLTPSRMIAELKKFSLDAPVYVVNMKPMYRDEIVADIAAQSGGREVNILEVGKVYEF